MTKLNQKRPWRKIIAWIGIAVLALILCVELTLRWMDHPSKAIISVYSGDGQVNSWLSNTGQHIVPTYQHKKAFQFTLEKQGPRIAVLGGSVVHGGSTDLRTEDEFPARLQVNAKVYNLANPSLDSHDQLALLEELANYKMDAWVVSTGHNDFGNTFLHQRYTHWPSGVLGTIGRLKEKLKLTQWTRTHLGAPAVNSAMPNPERQFSAPKVNQDQKEWALLHFKMNIDAMVKLAKENDTPLILIVPPRGLVKPPVGNCVENETCANDLWNKGMADKNLQSLSDASDADGIPFRIHSKAQDYLRKQAHFSHVWVVDPESLLPKDSDGLGVEGSLFQDNVHYTKSGHEAMATVISPIIQSVLAN